MLSRKDIAGLLNMNDVLRVVEQAFRQLAEGMAQMPPKAYLVLDKGDFRAMPASLPGSVGIKWVNVHPQNASAGLPTVMGILVYNDPDTGYPLAVMDATEFTAYRTGAAAAVASKYLARKDAHTLGIIGAGRQARTQLLAHAQLFCFAEVRVYDLSDAAVEKMLREYPQFPLRATSAREAAASDIVCTVTPARTPLVQKDWILPGTHINAVGADAAVKEELEPSILKIAAVIVDDVEQTTNGGEINVPIRNGLFRPQDISATLAEVITGRKPGRRNPDDVTIFDSTGVAIEDIAVAQLLYTKAVEKGGYRVMDFIQL